MESLQNVHKFLKTAICFGAKASSSGRLKYKEAQAPMIGACTNDWHLRLS